MWNCTKMTRPNDNNNNNNNNNYNNNNNNSEEEDTHNTRAKAQNSTKALESVI